MPSLHLPARPDLDHLKGQAHSLQLRVRAGEADALGIVRAWHPRPSAADAPATFRRTDAQLVVARRYGFASWPALRRHVAVVLEFGRSPHQRAGLATVAGGTAADLLRLGCLLYGGDDLDRHRQANALLARRPELAGATAWTAAAVGDVVALGAILAADRGAASRAGGPFDWAPLLYLAYSRIDAAPRRSEGDQPDPVAAARLLLAHGADPNAGYLWDGIYPFTALTGVLGGGEDKTNQPPHRHALALARVLLESGADPNDSQALYNRQFEPDDSHLRLLVEFGLGTDRRGPWHARLASAHGTPARLLEDQLLVAAWEDRPSWARLALAAGADPDGRGTRHPQHLGLTPIALALRRGNLEVAELLRRAGATPPPPDPVEAFLTACLGGDGDEAQRLLAEDPAVLAAARARRPEAVLAATAMRRPAAVRLLASLGFDVNVPARITPLHQAAYEGDADLVRCLLELGADPSAREPRFNATPLGWAEHARRDAVIDLLRTSD